MKITFEFVTISVRQHYGKVSLSIRVPTDPNKSGIPVLWPDEALLLAEALKLKAKEVAGQNVSR